MILSRQAAVLSLPIQTQLIMTGKRALAKMKQRTKNSKTLDRCPCDSGMWKWTMLDWSRSSGQARAQMKPPLGGSRMFTQRNGLPVIRNPRLTTASFHVFDKTPNVLDLSGSTLSPWYAWHLLFSWSITASGNRSKNCRCSVAQQARQRCGGKVVLAGLRKHAKRTAHQTVQPLDAQTAIDGHHNISTVTRTHFGSCMIDRLATIKISNYNNSNCTSNSVPATANN